MSPRRGSTAGRVYLDLQALARRVSRPAQEYLVMYALERFLARLARSPHRDRQWSAYMARSGLAGVLPASYADAIATVISFADPVPTGMADIRAFFRGLR